MQKRRGEKAEAKMCATFRSLIDGIRTRRPDAHKMETTARMDEEAAVRRHVVGCATCTFDETLGVGGPELHPGREMLWMLMWGLAPETLEAQRDRRHVERCRTCQIRTDGLWKEDRARQETLLRLIEVTFNKDQQILSRVRTSRQRPHTKG